MSKKESPQEIAAKRFEIISPLLDPNLDADMFCATKNKTASASGVSYRTIGRWYKRYKENGFAGLEPKAPISKQPTSKLPANFSEIVDNAIELRRECPTHSVQTLIQILELEGFIQPGTVTRSTLQRHLQNQGFGAKQIAMYQQVTPAARRFQKSYRGALYQGDIKYGPYLPIGPKGKIRPCRHTSYLLSTCRSPAGSIPSYRRTSGRQDRVHQL